MELYLVRHGDALPDAMDPERPLSPQGAIEADQMARRLKFHLKGLDTIWHSDKLRARQTAESFARELEISGSCSEQKGLGPNDPLEPILAKISEEFLTRKKKKLMMVGHLPLLGELASVFLAGTADRELITFPTAGVLCLESGGYGSWRVGWMVTPAIFAV